MNKAEKNECVKLANNPTRRSRASAGGYPTTSSLEHLGLRGSACFEVTGSMIGQPAEINLE
jgi:hypothetical protein